MTRDEALNRTGLASPEEIIAVLGRLPVELEELEFYKGGVVKKPVNSETRVAIYVAGELGFNWPGRYFLDTELYPKLRARGVEVIDPFVVCGKFLPEGIFDGSQIVRERDEKWARFNENVGFINTRVLIPRVAALIILGEGGRLDDGTAAEHTQAAMSGIPHFLVRSDLRVSENISPLNPANHVYSHQRYAGQQFIVPTATHEAYDQMLGAVGEFIRQRLTGFTDFTSKL